MKKLLNRALSIVLAVTMCAGLLSLSAFAAEAKCPTCGGTDIVEEKGKYVCRDCDDYVTLASNDETEEPEHEHSWRNVTAFCGGTFEHTLTCGCGATKTESNTGELGYNYTEQVIQCKYCAYYETAQCEHDWKCVPADLGKTHVRVCTKCYTQVEEDCTIVHAPEGYSYCELCGWDDKDIVLSKNCLKCGASDHKTDACPNWCTICNQTYILASCGGKYCSVNGQAVHIQKGTACRDTMNGFDTGNVHDHQCDFCHAEHLDCTSQVVTATCTKAGETIVKCGYPGCDYVVSETKTPALGHTFDKAEVSDNCESHEDEDCLDHTLTCSRCSGKEGKDDQGKEATVREKHTYDGGVADKVDGVEGTRYTCSICGHQRFEASQTYVLTINYVRDDLKTIFHTYKGRFAAGAQYSVTSQAAPAGYEFAVADGSDAVKSGTMPDRDLTINVDYKPITYTWTINYVDENGKPMDGMQTVTKTFTVNSIKDLTAVTSPTKEGYTADTTVVNAPTELGDVTVTVTYKLSAIYKLTVNHQYVAQDGTRTVVTQVIGNNYKMGDSYTTSPAARNGYTLSATPDNAKGVFEAKDVTVTYVYAETTQPTQPEVEDNDPDPTPEPPVNIDEPEVPLTGDPEVDIEEPDVDIEEPDVPLAEEPEVDIEEPDVPLAEVPETGDKFLLWGGLTLISGAGLTLLTLMDKKRKDDEA